MSTDSRIQSIIATHTAKLSALAVQQAELERSLIDNVRAAVLAIAPVGKSAGRSPGLARGEKRTREQIEAVENDIVEYIAKHPECRVEEIGKALSMSTSDLTLPMRELLASHRVTKKGEKRGTKYTVKASAKKSKPAKASKKRAGKRKAKKPVVKAASKKKVAKKSAAKAKPNGVHGHTEVAATAAQTN